LTSAFRAPTVAALNMQKLDFAEAVTIIADADPRYSRDAYFFLRDALDQTVKLRKRQLGEGGHVSGQQLCEGVRQHAIKSFGPMVPTVFEYWGIKKTDAFGDMVWNLIELGVFGKTPTDSIEDFKEVYDFHEAFVAPFLPDAPAKSSPNKRTDRVKY
jgi:uncharacterized repeat protein (TIGR04138 family)